MWWGVWGEGGRGTCQVEAVVVWGCTAALDVGVAVSVGVGLKAVVAEIPLHLKKAYLFVGEEFRGWSTPAD